MNYYNEFDPDAAQWLRNLITAGLIPDGDVDERSIEDVTPNDLRGYTQCHFFAGIGGWPLALDLAGWPRNMPAWTGSCPCQPFSSAGKGDGFADERHLWPAWFHLIRECRPNVVFGEQVASAIRHGLLDLVSADMEAEGYAVGGAVLGAHSVGAPHIRQRLYWVGMGDSECNGLRGSRRAAANEPDQSGNWKIFRMVRPNRPGSLAGNKAEATGHGRSAQSAGFWSGAEWIECRDGKLRPVEPGTSPLAHGVSARVVRLRGYGNAIVPQVAAAFVRAFMDVASEAENEAAA